MIVITVTRKPIERTVATNALKWGTGGINIDDSRIGHTEDFSDIKSRSAMKLNSSGKTHDPDCDSVREAQAKLQNLGRWPANLILCPETADELDAQSGIIQSSFRPGNRTPYQQGVVPFHGSIWDGMDREGVGFNDVGGASRYFKVIGKP